MSEIDLRHFVPMIRDGIELVGKSFFSRSFRDGLVDVGRSIRSNAFNARDKFPTKSFGDIIRAVQKGASRPVILPEVCNMIDYTIGGISPYYYIGAIVGAASPETIVEIGTYLGTSALTMALNSGESTRIITVDLPENFSRDSVKSLTKGDIALMKAASIMGVGESFRRHPMGRKIQQVFSNSYLLDLTKYVECIDFSFIDGGHSYDLIKGDTEKCLKLLSRDGIIVWDDYRWGLPGVQRYLTELSRSLPLWRIRGTQYVIYSAALPA